MSRFDYDDDGERHITFEMWQYNETRALQSPKGQARMREFRDALLAVPNHRLIEDKIADLNGDMCAIGAFAAYKRVQKGATWALATAELNQQFHPVTEPRRGRGGLWWGENWDPPDVDAWETQELGVRECGLNRTLAWSLAYNNDEGVFWARTPEGRWWKAYTWVCEVLGETPDRTLMPDGVVS